MADLSNYEVYINGDYEVLTDNGFQDFKGIIIGENTDKISLTFDSGDILTCTPKHKLVLSDKSVKYAKDIESSDELFGGAHLIEATPSNSTEKVYELLHVDNTHRYFVNNVLSQQCLIIDEAAWILPHIMDEFWNSVVPIISSSSNTKIFLISTANGTSNKFYDIYSKAERGEAREWHHERMDWWEMPGRGKKWMVDMTESLGSKEAFDQEFGCLGSLAELRIRKIGSNIEETIKISDLYQKLS